MFKASFLNLVCLEMAVYIKYVTRKKNSKLQVSKNKKNFLLRLVKVIVILEIPITTDDLVLPRVVLIFAYPVLKTTYLNCTVK